MPARSVAPVKSSAIQPSKGGIFILPRGTLLNASCEIQNRMDEYTSSWCPQPAAETAEDTGGAERRTVRQALPGRCLGAQSRALALQFVSTLTVRENKAVISRNNVCHSEPSAPGSFGFPAVIRARGEETAPPPSGRALYPRPYRSDHAQCDNLGPQTGPWTKLPAQAARSAEPFSRLRAGSDQPGSLQLPTSRCLEHFGFDTSRVGLTAWC
jgi:hypothetical protein